MRLIFLRLLRFSHRTKGLLSALVVLCMWLGMCQPAAAAVACSANVDSQLIIYNGGNIAAAQLGMSGGCSGFAPPPYPSGNYYNMCTTADASTSTGSGGTTVLPYRVAKSPAGHTLNFQLSSSQTSQTDPAYPLTGPNLLIWQAVVGGPSRYDVTGLTKITVTVPASQNVPAGDYISMVPFTMQFRYIVKSTTDAFNSCTTGTLINTAVVNVPVRIRVGGTSCAINPSTTTAASFGDISVINGSVVEVYRNFRVNVTCASGTAYNVKISGGNNFLGAGNSIQRRMANGSSFINYNVIYPTGNNLDGWSGTGTGANAEQNYTLLLPSQTAASLNQGVYSDTVIISLSY